MAVRPREADGRSPAQPCEACEAVRGRPTGGPSCWCSGGRSSSDGSCTSLGAPFLRRAPPTVVPPTALADVLAVDAQAGQEAREERGKRDVRFRGGRGRRRRGCRAVVLRRVEEAAGVAAEQAVVDGVGGGRLGVAAAGLAPLGGVAAGVAGCGRPVGAGRTRARLRSGALPLASARTAAARTALGGGFREQGLEGATSWSMASKTDETSWLTSPSWTGRRSRRAPQASRWEREKASRAWMGPRESGSR